MRVLMVTGEFRPMQGGVGDFTYCLTAELAHQGCEVTVLAPEGCAADGAEMAVLPLARRWGWRDLCLIGRLAARCDVVNLQYQAAAYGMRLPIHLLPRLLGERAARLVTTFHDLRVPYLFPKAGRVRTSALRWLLEGSDAAILTNEEDLAEAAGMAPHGHSHLVRIGSNVEPEPPDEARRASLRRQWGCGPDTIVLCYFGFQNASKGSLDLVQAAGDLVVRGRDVRLVFAGGETGASDVTNRAYAERVRTAVVTAGLGDRVTFTGYLPRAEVSQVLYASDMCVLPYRDGASFRRGSLMAALAHGMPIVTTRPALPIAGLSDGATVLLVPRGDVAALAEAVAVLADDAGRRAELGRRARALADAFAWSAIARDTIAVYDSFLTMPRATPARA
ncbi:MAG: glycosyltransferase family 4 protein [Anaerolineae bacterium]